MTDNDLQQISLNDPNEESHQTLPKRFSPLQRQVRTSITEIVIRDDVKAERKQITLFVCEMW